MHVPHWSRIRLKIYSKRLEITENICEKILAVTDYFANRIYKNRPLQQARQTKQCKFETSGTIIT